MEIACSYSALESVENLRPNPKNPNKHSEIQISLLAKNIEEFGWRHPIVVSKRSGLVVSGHARLEAAKLLELDEVPVDLQDFESDEEEMAVLIADNRLAELAEVDSILLVDMLEELQSMGVDMELTGYGEDAMKLLMNGGKSETPPEFPEANENIPVDYQCPKCGYKWSGKPSYAEDE